MTVLAIGLEQKIPESALKKTNLTKFDFGGMRLGILRGAKRENVLEIHKAKQRWLQQ